MRRRIILLLTIFCAISLQGLADFKMPKRVYRMKQLDAAKAKAKDRNKPITFIYTHEKTSCGLCAKASLNIADTLKSKSVLVYVDCENERELIPPLIQEALQQPEAGRYVPQTVIVDSGITKVITIVPYAKGTEQDKLLKEAKKEISKAQQNNARKPLRLLNKTEISTIQPDENREIRIWTSISGVEVRAALVQESGQHLILKRENGSRLKILMSKLSSKDQQYVQELKEGN